MEFDDRINLKSKYCFKNLLCFSWILLCQLFQEQYEFAYSKLYGRFCRDYLPLLWWIFFWCERGRVNVKRKSWGTEFEFAKRQKRKTAKRQTNPLLWKRQQKEQFHCQYQHIRIRCRWATRPFFCTNVGQNVSKMCWLSLQFIT